MQACIIVFLGDFECVILVFFFVFFVGLGTYFCYKCCNTVTSLYICHYKMMTSDQIKTENPADRTEPCRW